MRNVVVGVVALILIFGGGWWYLTQQKTESGFVREETSEAPQQKEPEDVRVLDAQGAAIGDENLVNFTCDGGTTITAVFERDIVGVTLSDGRQLVLRQAESGSGIRYLSNDTSVEFRGKGNEGTLIEGGVTTYAGCVASN